jgi:Zn-dependent alcohol dehydrogenase
MRLMTTVSEVPKIRRDLGIFRSGRLKLGEFVSERATLVEINAAIEPLRDGSLEVRCRVRL